MERPEDRFATRSSTVRVPSPLDAQRAFEYKYESQSNLKVLPSEKVNDRACYVIEGDQHDDKGNFQRKIVEWLDAESGIVMKRHMFDESGNLISEMRVTELKLNVNIDPQRFVFKAPPGVKIQ
jgi:outer membrane lipoprotein-sorting protein